MNLYPTAELFNSFQLPVSDMHSIYVEESGNKNGKPVIFLHGGPGGGISSSYRQYFDPEKWRIIMFDQRGCGKSTPFAELKENTTWDLVEDIEKIRKHLGIDSWVVFGGSWGSTLSLAYSQTHPSSCKGLILRGIFLVRKKEIDWFYQEGANNIFPDRWESFLAPIAPDKRSNLLKAYYEILTGDDHSKKIEAAKAWSTWEGSTVRLLLDENFIGDFSDEKFAEAFARIECHYFMNNCWFNSDNYLIENIDKIRNIPAVIVHGRYDIICPV
ncbi:MAG: prolyl aminopeptidase, partial [Candidatus Marinimicrobia bacterium]|nr:prolyl aminopeptidase [Candidatus Neomarinimicrobiota bacterium]